jgi:hypothetical protein
MEQPIKEVNMQKYATEKHPIEQALQKIEKLMDQEGITITSYGASGFTVTMRNINNEFWIQSSDNGERSYSLPRLTEDERLAIIE